MRQILRKLVQSTDGMLPATVIAADAQRQFVTVQPAVKVLGVDGTVTDRAKIARVPIFNIGAGGWVLSFPINPGDLGWIIASDRDISLFIQASAATAPNTNRLHSFEDGLFIPDAARKFTLSSDDTADAVWQSYDHTIRIVLGADKIKIIHPTKVEVTSPLVTMSGDLMVTGTITGAVDTLGGGKSLKTHAHSGGTISGDTGPPL